MTLKPENLPMSILMLQLLSVASLKKIFVPLVLRLLNDRIRGSLSDVQIEVGRI